MSIASEISRLQTAKADIKTAIETKGVTVPSSASIDTYDDYILAIDCSGGTSGIPMPASANSITLDDMGRVTSIEYKEGVTSIPSDMFNGNIYLSAITLPSTISNIGNNAFNGTSGLSSITINSTTPPSLGDGAFDATTYPIYVPCDYYYSYYNSQSWGKYIDRIQCGGVVPESGTKFILMDANGDTVSSGACGQSTTLNELDIPSPQTKAATISATVGSCVTSISGAFTNCSAMTNVLLPNTITSIDYQTFAYCYALSAITLPSSLQYIGNNAFSNCRSLRSINIPSGIDHIYNYTFTQCWQLSSVTMSNVQYIEPYAFEWCSALTDVHLSSSLEMIHEGAFTYCTSLSSITIPSSVTYIGDAAFAWCSGLTAITCLAEYPPILGSSAFSDTNDCDIFVPDTSLNDYLNDWYEYASRIKPLILCEYNLCGTDANGDQVTIDNGGSILYDTDLNDTYVVDAIIGTATTEIAQYALSPIAYTLTSLTLSNTLTTIGGESFFETDLLTTLTIPSSVSEIGFWAFTRCSGLTEVIFKGTTPPSFNDGEIFHDYCPPVIWVPDDALSDYRSSNNWTDVENFDPYTTIQPISDRTSN